MRSPNTKTAESWRDMIRPGSVCNYGLAKRCVKLSCFIWKIFILDFALGYTDKLYRLTVLPL